MSDRNRPEHSIQEQPSAESLADVPEGNEEDWSGAVRGLGAARAKWGGRVRIDEDLRQRFPTERAVNEALRSLVELMDKLSSAERRAS